MKNNDLYKKITSLKTIKGFDFIFVVFLVLLNAILKIIYLDSTNINGDEPFSIYHAHLNIKTIILELSKGNNPPLFEILLHYWIRLFGISPFATRFLPYLSSTFIVIFIFKIGMKHINIHTAVIASLFFTFSHYNLFFSQETRVYSLLGFLTAISFYLFFELNKNPNNSNKAWLGIINTLLIYSHFFGLFII